VYHTCLGETLNDLIQMKNSTKKRMQEAVVETNLFELIVEHGEEFIGWFE
jgi:hypothetical protein